mmetsp:Transcript_1455/g.2259  ORF Transcript_1455/g.2259 Transcript_1455/m.2259 type:complete len:96 (-) Transcript_1455:150-437(-)
MARESSLVARSKDDLVWALVAVITTSTADPGRRFKTEGTLSASVSFVDRFSDVHAVRGPAKATEGVIREEKGRLSAWRLQGFKTHTCENAFILKA